jgi:hypothetical protein
LPQRKPALIEPKPTRMLGPCLKQTVLVCLPRRRGIWLFCSWISRLAKISSTQAQQTSQKPSPTQGQLLTGEANASATVTLNDQPTTRHGTYFHGELQIDNEADTAYQAVTNMAVLNQPGNPDLMSTNVG